MGLGVGLGLWWITQRHRMTRNGSKGRGEKTKRLIGGTVGGGLAIKSGSVMDGTGARCVGRNVIGGKERR